ncbi:MAG: hypothetical protein J0L84_12745 [Verrucomicrobia bacterium]|nr:hypothetical protein [Verrucomicrobiota bacterium]
MVSATLAGAIRRYWIRLPDAAGRGELSGLHRWMRRGLLTPVLAWSIWHLAALFPGGLALYPILPPMAGGRWGTLLLGVAAFTGITGIAWSLVSLAWLLPDAVTGIRRRADFRVRTFLIGLPTLALVVWAGARQSWLLALILLTAGLWLLLHQAADMIHVPQVSYLKAVARMKFGRYEEAEQEVLRQLDEKADDFEGWLMLASLYAERFGDLAGADQTIRDLTAQEGLTPYQISHAFTRLADWQLNLGSNPAAARAALSEIVQRCPETPFARVAEHRIRELPLDEAEHLERRRPRALKLPALSEAAPVAAAATAPVDQLDARTEASRLESRLAHRPEDLATRERLARLLAERLGQVGPAIEHLNQLRLGASAGDTRRAEWLALEATWELRLRRREPRARALLVQVIQEHPDSPQCLAARRQLELLDRATETAAAPAPPSPPPRIRLPGFDAQGKRMKEEG